MHAYRLYAEKCLLAQLGIKVNSVSWWLNLSLSPQETSPSAVAAGRGGGCGEDEEGEEDSCGHSLVCAVQGGRLHGGQLLTDTHSLTLTHTHTHTLTHTHTHTLSHTQLYSVPEFKLVFSVRNFSSAPTTLKDSGTLPQQQRYMYVHVSVLRHGISCL